MPGAPLELPALTQAVDLVNDLPKTLYPDHIPLQHRQLRHFLKTTETGLTYYATGNVIWALRNGRRKRVASLDFSIYCLTAGHGWVCAGGIKNGRCAFLRPELPEDTTSQSNAEVDALLPLNLPSTARSDSPEGLRRVRAGSTLEDPPLIKSLHYHNVGADLVNAITLYSIQPDKQGCSEETVALLANNDCTVTIFSLSQMRTLQTLHFEKPMNHASLSPDGKLLLACGDIKRAYFFQRHETHYKSSTRYMAFTWQPFTSLRLFKHDCFTTGFSPDGRFCTVASQDGNMVKLDVSALHADMKDEEAIVSRLTSSRVAPVDLESTYSWRGAIRSTTFSPPTWAMFAWAEARGRICVGDLRDPYRPAQVIQLFKKDPKNTVVETAEALADDSPDDDASSFSQTLRRLGISPPLSTSRSAREQLNEVSSAMDHLEESAHQRRVEQILRSLDRDHGSRLDEPPRLQDLMDEIREMGDDLDSTASENAARGYPPLPRRRSSVVFGTAATSAGSANSSTLAPIISSVSTLSTSPSQLTRDRTNDNLTPPPPINLNRSAQSSTPDPWQTISAAMSAEPASRRASLEANLRNLRETRDSLQRAQRASRLRAEQLAHEMELERQSTARLRTSRPLPWQSQPFRSAVSTARNRRSAHEGDSQVQSDIEDSLEDSTSRLAQLERGLEQLESRQARSYNNPSRQTSQAGNTPAQRGATASSTYRNLERQYQRLLQIDPSAPRYQAPPNEEATLLRQWQSMGDVHDSSGDDNEVVVMGLDWSFDGRLLFVATDVGIFELKVNLAGRKLFPAAIQPR